MGIAEYKKFEGTIISENESWELKVDVLPLAPSDLIMLRFWGHDKVEGTDTYHEHFLTAEGIAKLKALL